MKRLPILFAVLLAANQAFAQGDSTSYFEFRKISESDLAKKREGTFVTGLPDFSSDPVADFGFGARTNIFWNSKRQDRLFAYKPLASSSSENPISGQAMILACKNLGFDNCLKYGGHNHQFMMRCDIPVKPLELYLDTKSIGRQLQASMQNHFLFLTTSKCCSAGSWLICAST
ncbi:hypothetical protein SAMN04487996_111298 [Dyadobacter soli]|uniref:DUF5982 domain-containing protein n=1 Tax=Dyadobacter soli TaxID=659014 RepID=A0A1G7MKD2_9BACT|nr:DUF5982 domain-containing protein [Dyadobacter soli]SDF62066.1 hypothetical protein SAMN04487996_111298 [Dyadobacter soli]